MKKLNKDRKKYIKIIETHKNKLKQMGVLKTIGANIKTYNKLVYNKRLA